VLNGGPPFGSISAPIICRLWPRGVIPIHALELPPFADTAKAALSVEIHEQGGCVLAELRGSVVSDMDRANRQLNRAARMMGCGALLELAVYWVVGLLLCGVGGWVLVAWVRS
jgi:hypothetical protein